MGFDQEIKVLVHIIPIHTAAGVSGFLVTAIQGVVFVNKAWCRQCGLKCGMFLPGTALAAAGDKFRHG